jgi:hypothetical protein
VTGDHVELRLASGESRRFAMVDVAYAGAAADQPGAAPQTSTGERPFVTVDASEARIHFESTTPDTDLHVRTEEETVSGLAWGGRGPTVYAAVARGYLRICGAPCDATLPAGTHRLALSFKGRSPVEPAGAVTIDGSSTLRGTYVDRRAAREGGWALLGIAVAAGTALMVAGELHATQDCSSESFTGSCISEPAPSGSLIAAGVAVTALGTLTGLALALQHDGAIIEVVPVATGPASPPLARREGAWLASGAAAPSGLAVRVRF